MKPTPGKLYKITQDLMFQDADISWITSSPMGYKAKAGTILMFIEVREESPERAIKEGKLEYEHVFLLGEKRVIGTYRRVDRDLAKYYKEVL
jgi:prephenate dehydratase